MKYFLILLLVALVAAEDKKPEESHSDKEKECKVSRDGRYVTYVRDNGAIYDTVMRSYVTVGTPETSLTTTTPARTPLCTCSFHIGRDYRGPVISASLKPQ